jgi:hypothetical protein
MFYYEGSSLIKVDETGYLLDEEGNRIEDESKLLISRWKHYKARLKLNRFFAIKFIFIRVKINKLE